MKYVLNFTAILIVLPLLAVFVRAQGGWIIVEGSKTTDGLEFTTTEKHTDGRTRITSEFYFRHKPSQIQGSRVITKDKDGTFSSVVHASWDSDGRQIAAGEQFQDANQRTIKGKRWFYDQENGRYVEPRIDQVFNNRTKEWETIKKQETVRIMFSPSREADAKTTADRLRTEGFDVELRGVAKSEEYDSPHRGKLYYSGQTGTRETADRIINFANKVEALTPVVGTATSDANAPDYSLWLVSHKQNLSRFQGVFMNPFGTLIGIKADENGLRVGFAEKIADSEQYAWKKTDGGNLRGNPFAQGSEIHTSLWTGCALEGKITGRNDLPARFVFTDNNWKFQVVRKEVKCEEGQPVILDNWRTTTAGPYSMDFLKVSFDPPSGN